jgi:glutamine amidotransferase
VVAIVDYGMGNLMSVYNALDILGFESDIVTDPEKLKQYDYVILPGVGSFRVCMENLIETGFDQSLIEFANSGKPLMGICLGMQILASRGCEDGVTRGLGLIEGEVIRFDNVNYQLKIPHVGWNDVEFKWSENHPLAKRMKKKSVFYFTHSYYFNCANLNDSIADTDYGEIFTSAVLKDNIFATQFHPEKSQEIGLKLFQNFINWKL